MKRKLFLFAALALVAAAFAFTARNAEAQSATDAPWTSSITYYTPSSTGAVAEISYYPDGSSTPVDVVTRELEPNAAGSIFIGATNVPAGFKGGAVISSDNTVVATGVLFANGAEANNYGRVLYSGFSADQASDNFFIPTVLYRQFNTSTSLGIQNVSGTDTVATLNIYAAGATIPTATHTYNIVAQSSKIVAPSELGLPNGFTGSATIETNNGAAVVAVAQETHDSGRAAYAFEGVAASSASNTVYLASMLCNAFGGQNSFYAVQNASFVDAADIEIVFYDTEGNIVGDTYTNTLPAGAKVSVNPCNANVPAGTSGSAVVTSTGAPVVAIGKVSAPNGMVTSFVGESAGSTDLAGAYVRWAANPASEFRAFIAIMNVGDAPAEDITATYYDVNGDAVQVVLASASSPLDPFIKVNTNPNTAGAVDANGEFGTPASVAGVGGAVEINSDQPVVVVVRLSRAVSLGATTTFAEDYNAVNIAP